MTHTKLIEELEGYENHCMNTGQEQVADLVGRAITALQGQWVPVRETDWDVINSQPPRDLYVETMDAAGKVFYNLVCSKLMPIGGATQWTELPTPPEAK